jgi:hypothetical protein
MNAQGGTALDCKVTSHPFFKVALHLRRLAISDSCNGGKKEKEETTDKQTKDKRGILVCHERVLRGLSNIKSSQVNNKNENQY